MSDCRTRQSLHNRLATVSRCKGTETTQRKPTDMTTLCLGKCLDVHIARHVDQHRSSVKGAAAARITLLRASTQIWNQGVGRSLGPDLCSKLQASRHFFSK